MKQKANIQQTLFDLESYERPATERKWRNRILRHLYKNKVHISSVPIAWKRCDNQEFNKELDEVLLGYQSFLLFRGKGISRFGYEANGKKFEMIVKR